MDNGVKSIGKRKFWLLGGIAVAVIVMVFVIWAYFVPSVSRSLDIPGYVASAITAPTGAGWEPTDLDASGFAAVTRTERYELRVSPTMGQALIRDLQSGNEWASNPDPSLLELQKVAGVLKTNLSSPFILEYAEKNKVQRLVVNSRSADLKFDLTTIQSGVAVHYDFTKLGLQFSMLYELTDKGFQVSIPANSLVETGEFHILSIDPLPFFGAAQDEAVDEGYLLVPDGPGALIRFPRERELIGKGYYQYVYGSELTNKLFGSVTVSMPVFGMKKGKQAYLAVITQGEKSAAIRALPAGIVSTLNSINTRFNYREEYNRRLNLSGRAIRVFQQELLREDRQIQYYFLDEAEADYAGMAKKYREFLLDTGELGPALAPSEDIPMHLTIVGGDTLYYGDSQYEISTTFKQGEGILRELKSAGVKEIRLTYQNWQHKGSLSPSLKLVVEKRLGGENGLRTFIAAAHELGFKVYLQAELIRADSEGLKLSPKTFGVRSVEGDTLFDFEYFYLNPNVTYNLADDLIQDAAGLKADGIHYNWIGQTVLRDHNPRYNYTRNDTAYIYNRILERTQQVLGAGSAYLGNAYALRYLNDIQEFPGETHQYYALDEAVPFYPMAVHGHVTYSLLAGNLRSQYEDEFLRAIEYGAVPSFILTSESSRTLMQTKTFGIFTSQFSQWKDKVVKEYASFNQLAGLHHQTMTGHYKRAEGIYVTEYADGTAVVVDYIAKSFRVEKGGGRS